VFAHCKQFLLVDSTTPIFNKHPEGDSHVAREFFKDKNFPKILTSKNSLRARIENLKVDNFPFEAVRATKKHDI